MYKVLVSNLEHSPAEVYFPIRDLAIASVSLKEPITNLEHFINRLTVLGETEYAIQMTNETSKITKDYVLFKDNTILVFIEIMDWRGLTILFGLYNTSDKDETLKEIKSFNEIKHLDLITYSHTLEKFQQELQSFRKGFLNELEFFNINKAITEFERRDIKAELYNNKILVTFDNIKIGSEHEGFLTYNSIVLFIKQFAIDGFILRFDKFDFNSYWKIPVILHPYLSTPYGFNNCLEYLPPNNYSIFVDFLVSLVKDYEVSGGYKTITSIMSDFQDLRILWNEMKHKTEDRIELSKIILKQKEELL